jgi:DNA-binding transcriptional LysR family regulator
MPRFVVQRDSFSALLFLLLQTDFVAIATEPAVQPFCEKGLLTRISLSRWQAVSVQSLVRVASRPLSPRAEALATEIKRISKSLRR